MCSHLLRFLLGWDTGLKRNNKQIQNNSNNDTCIYAVVESHRCVNWLHVLPVQSSSRCLVLDVGEDRLVLTARPTLFHLDVFHPFLIEQENSVAQFNKSTQVPKAHINGFRAKIHTSRYEDITQPKRGNKHSDTNCAPQQNKCTHTHITPSHGWNQHFANTTTTGIGVL